MLFHNAPARDVTFIKLVTIAFFEGKPLEGPCFPVRGFQN
jgi:hypothetical protein